MSAPPVGGAPAGVAAAAGAMTQPVAEVTGRALGAGAAMGAVVAVINVHMGLRAGLWESGNLLAALVAYSAMAAGARGGPGPSVLETNVAQVLACSMGAMPAAMGLLGAMPALGALGHELPGWAVVLWGVGLGALGVALAHALRGRLMEQERLPFPTGVATAELIGSLHAQGVEGSHRARGLWGTGALAAVLTVLRDGVGWLPGAWVLPGQVGGVSAATLGLGVGVSPMFLGVGAMVGVQTGLSLLLGAAVGWGVAAPVLVQQGRAGADYAALSGWLMWPGVGLLAGAGVASLLVEVRRLRQAAEDLGSLRLRHGVWAAGVCGAALALGAGLALGLSPLYALGALALLLPLVAVCARSAGEVDFSPAGQVAQLTQLTSGVLAPGQAGTGVAAGAVVGGTASQVGASLWALRAGHLLGASMPRLLGVQLGGVLLGAAVALPAYGLLVREQVPGSASLPAPNLAQFLVVARLVEGGAQGLPSGALLAGGLGLAAGALLALAGRGRLGPWLPTPAGLGLGLLLPASFCTALCLGALLRAAARWCWRARAEQQVPALAAGAIAGEGLLGLALSVLRVLGLMGPP